VSANHILQNVLSAKYFPEWKWALIKRLLAVEFEACIDVYRIVGDVVWSVNDTDWLKWMNY
jgi:hypothetical protein